MSRKQNLENDLERVVAILAAHGRDGLTAGQVAKIGKRSKGWAYSILRKLTKTGEVFRCEVPNGIHGLGSSFIKVIYFTETRMKEMNGGKLPVAGSVYVIKQRIVSEIAGIVKD